MSVQELTKKIQQETEKIIIGKSEKIRLVIMAVLAEGHVLLNDLPGVGKTTALREIVRKLSDSGQRICLVDERNELAAFDTGKAQFDVGSHTDIMTGINKAQAAIMLLRGMNPQLVAVDEITRAEDCEAIAELYGCGVGIIATAHAADHRELYSRRLYKRLLDTGIFKNLLIVNAVGGERTYRVKKLCT